MSTVIDVLKRHSVLHAPPGKPFILKSGVESMHYVDVRLTALTSRGLSVLADHLFINMVNLNLRPERIAGVALGGCPLATGVSLRSRIDALYVRSEAKDHGTGKLIEGLFNPGDTVVLCEDVITSGKSTLNAMAALRAAGLDVIGVLAILDREQGGAALIEKECQFAALVTMKELLT